MARRVAFIGAIVTAGARWARGVLDNTLLALGVLVLVLGVGVSGVLVGQPGWFIGGLAALVVLLVLGEGAFRVWAEAEDRAAPTVGASRLERWLQERIDAAAAIARERRVHDDWWFIRTTGDWDTANVSQMALGDEPVAPDLVDSYRRDPVTGQIGVPPPHGVGEYERHFEQRLAWLTRTLDGLRRGA